MNFLEQQVFSNNRINVLHNQILRLSPSLGITGSVAKIIQGNLPTNTEIKNSALVTTEIEDFEFLQSELEREFQMDLTTLNIVDNCIQAVIQGTYVEIWHITEAEFTTINELKVQTNIPNNIL